MKKLPDELEKEFRKMTTRHNVISLLMANAPRLSFTRVRMLVTSEADVVAYDSG